MSPLVIGLVLLTLALINAVLGCFGHPTTKARNEVAPPDLPDSGRYRAWPWLIEGPVRAFLINLSFAGVSTALTTSPTHPNRIAIFACVNATLGCLAAVILKDQYDLEESMQKACRIKVLTWVGLAIYAATVAIFALLS